MIREKPRTQTPTTMQMETKPKRMKRCQMNFRTSVKFITSLKALPASLIISQACHLMRCSKLFVSNTKRRN